MTGDWPAIIDPMELGDGDLGVGRALVAAIVEVGTAEPQPVRPATIVAMTNQRPTDRMPRSLHPCPSEPAAWSITAWVPGTGSAGAHEQLILSVETRSLAHQSPPGLTGLVVDVIIVR